LFQFGEGQNCKIFTKIGTKLRQKLKYRDQIENEEMTSSIRVTRDIVTITWYNISLTRVKFLNFSKNSKTIQKIQELTRDTPFNVVTAPLTEKT